MTSAPHAWPDLAGLDLASTTDALHLWSQVVGKVRLMRTPWINQSWHVALYLSARGFTTGLVQADGIQADGRAFELEFDLLADALRIEVTDGRSRRVALRPQSVADFHAATLAALKELDLGVEISGMPCEIPDAVPFAGDQAVRAYDGETARAYWRAMVQAHRVLQQFRSRFVGKTSPIHLFWGSFDLAVTRFSGRPAPRHPGGAPHLPDAVAREAYCEEVSSAGFWPGGGEGARFYSYAYPAPAGFAAAKVAPAAAFYDEALGEFILPYDAVQRSADPHAALMAFLQSTYEAAADLAGWDRGRLERPQGPYGRPPPGY